MTEIPSPCIDVCKYKLRGGHCIGCAMTEWQKKAFKHLDPVAQRAFLSDLIATQKTLGIHSGIWAKSYRRACAKQGMPCPLDEAGAAAGS